MTNYDFNPHIYEEIQQYYEFLKDDKKFSEDLKNILSKNDGPSKGILRSPSRKV